MKKIMKPAQFQNPSINSNHRSLKKNDPSQIWDDVSELTDGIFIIGNLIFDTSIEVDRIKKFLSQWSQRYKKNSQNHVVINLYEYPKNNFENFEGIPRNLSNLSDLIIICSNFKSFKGLPKNLPKLKKIKIGFQFLKNINAPLKNLNHFPSSLPSLETIDIYNSQLNTFEGLPSHLDSLIGLSVISSNLQSLEHLPKFLPNFIGIKISNSNLNSLKYFPNHIPNLRFCDFSNNKIESLKYLPSELPNVEKFNILGNPLKSFENLPIIKKRHKFILNTSIRTLYDITNRFLNDGGRNNISNTKFIDIDWLFNFTNYLFKQSEKEIYNSLCSYALNLLRNFKTKNIQYVDLDYDERILIPFSDDTFLELKERFINRDDIDTLKSLRIVYTPNQEIFKEIVELYRKSPMELAIQYSKNPKSLSEGEISRLCWEAETDERKILENTVPPNDPIFQLIDQRLSAKMKNGFKIFL